MTNGSRPALRVGIIGAGYISSWHAIAIGRSPDGELAGVADLARSAAEGLAAGRPVYGSAEEMLATGAIDLVHILTPPASHAPLAKLAIEKGVPVLIEKPVATSLADAESVLAAARGAGVPVGVMHNFLALPAYERLRSAVKTHKLGKIDTAEMNWRFPLTPLRSGPFGLWMLREPRNLLLELGAHLFSFVEDLFGPMTDVAVRLTKPIEIPGGIRHWQSWQILGSAGATDITINMSLVEGHDDRSVVLRGVTGAARLDFAANRLEMRRSNAADIVISDLSDSLSLSGQYLVQGFGNAVTQLRSLNKDQPYGLGINRAVASVHRSIRRGEPIDQRFSIETAVNIARAMEDAIAAAGDKLTSPGDRAPRNADPGDSADALVIGGTGFIGRYLVEALAAAGKSVRVMSRGRPAIFDHLPGVSVVSGSLRDREALLGAMTGVGTVYHLAKAEEATWAGYVENDVKVTELIGEVALEAGVGRLVYTGTIDSYASGDPGQVITEDTGFAADMSDRNLYARSKAACEDVLLAMHRDKGLPLVIVRPGIVIGRGGPLQHWGIGRWKGAGAVRLWSTGREIQPFALVEDVAQGLVLAGDAPGIEGESFNLIGDPMLTATEYFAAINERGGVSIVAKAGNAAGFFVSDAAKTFLKARLLNARSDRKPSLTDWKARTQAARYDNTKAKKVLGWKPEADREAFLRRAVDEANLFGF